MSLVLGGGELRDALDQTLSVAQPDDLKRYKIVIGQVEQFGARNLVVHEVASVLAHSKVVEPMAHLLRRPGLRLCKRKR
jgi:hypothetical protein